MKNLIPFSYEDTEIRAVEIDGEPWLVAKDICDYFGVSNRNRLLQQVDSLDKGGTRLDTPGGTQEFTVINESGFYTVIFALNQGALIERRFVGTKPVFNVDSIDEWLQGLPLEKPEPK